MNRYKILNVNEIEIENFSEFLNKSSKNGWHPVRHWARSLGILKFTKDEDKKGAYSVVFNQARVGSQVRNKRGLNNSQVDREYKEFLSSFDIDFVLTYRTKYDIFYSENGEEIITDESLQENLIKSHIKKVNFGFIFLAILNIFLVYVLLSISGIFSNLITLTIIPIIINTVFILSNAMKGYRGLQYLKGKKITRKSKWISTKTDYISLMISVISIMSFITYTLLVYNNFNILTYILVPLTVIITSMLYVYFSAIDNSMTNKNKRIIKFLSSLIVLVILVSVISINKEKLFLNQEVAVENEIIALFDEDIEKVHSFHSFLVQEFNVYLKDYDIKVYKIKTNVFTSFFKDLTMKNLGVENYIDGEIYKGTIKYGRFEEQIDVFVKGDLIITASDENTLAFKKLLISMEK